MQCSQSKLKIGDFTFRRFKARGMDKTRTRKEALQLLRVSRSSALAKQTLDVVQETMSTAAQQELAQDLGYSSVPLMLEQTELVALPNSSFMHLTTDADGYWVA